MAGPEFVFGPFHYDASQRLLFRGTAIVALVPKVADTLHVLLEERGRVVEKAQLMRRVWGATVVEEVGLARNVSLLRKALGDESGESYIETIPKRGYRFRAEVATLPAPEVRPVRRKVWLRFGAACSVAAMLGGLVYWQFYVPSRYLPPGVDLASMAVIPFETLSQQGEPAAAVEFNEILVAEVSKLDGVQAMSPSTVARYQRLGISLAAMARLLRLQVILEGTILQKEGRTTLTARLADVRSGKLIWADHYETGREPGLDVAQAIARQVGAHLAIHGRLPKGQR